MPFPFANGGTKDDIGIADSATAPNLTTGFPPVFEAAVNGQYVTRAQMNGVLNLATANEYARQCGQVVTFNPTVASAIGGYGKGAILDYINGGTAYKVISLVGNNVYNFVENGVDGINWAYCSTSINRTFPDIYRSQEIVNASIQSVFDGNKAVTEGAVSSVYTLDRTSDFFVSFSFITNLTSNDGYDLEFAIRNTNASTSEYDWKAIQSSMWLSSSGSGSTGYINGNICLHGGQSFAIVNPTRVTATAINGAWLTIRAFPLVA